MFCPGCGGKTSAEQRFCRSCGMNVESIVASMLEQLPAARQELVRQEEKLERFGSIAFGGFGVVLGIGFLGLLYWIFSKMVLSGTQPAAGVLLMAFLVFAGLTLTYVFLNESLKEKRNKLASIHFPREALEGQTPHHELPDRPPDHIPSAVEDTTRTLVRPTTNRLD